MESARFVFDGAHTRFESIFVIFSKKMPPVHADLRIFYYLCAEYFSEPHTIITMYTQRELSDMIQKGIEQLDYPTHAPSLYDPVRYTLEAGGKRLRPTLVLMAANLFADDIRAAIDPALGIEMYHNFTLLHDDVMDKAPERRGRDTVHVKWNDNQAILSGDAMQGLAYQLIASTPVAVLKPVLDAFNTMNLEIGEGQQMDIEFETRQDVTIEEYIEMIRLKTSVLLGHALEIGALIGLTASGRISTNNPEIDAQCRKDIETLYRFGEEVGLAFQLQDDWLDCWGDPATFGKRIGGDILCDKKTFIRISAEKVAPAPDCTGMSEEEKIQAFKAYYIATGAEEACRQAIATHHRLALDALAEISVDEEKLSLLKAFAAKLENRNV